MTKSELPTDWRVRRVGRVLVFTCDCGPWEQLTVKRRHGIWRLLVNENATCHHFASAKDAILHADDVRAHAH